MEKENRLVIDVGTQSLRASVINRKGETLAFSQQKYPVAYNSPASGFAEQDADFYLDRLCLATNDLKVRYPDILSSVLGRTRVPFRDTAVLLDKDKNPIRPCILWLDQRVERLNGKNLKWYERILFHVIGRTDTVVYNSERTGTHWIKSHEKVNWAKRKYYVPLGGYFNYKVTGNLVCSTADTIGHYPINFKTGKWYGKLHPKQSVFGIPFSALPPLVEPSSVIGKVTDEFSVKSSIPEGTPVFACGSDKSCETFGNGCRDKTTASISLGTACSIDVVDQKYSEPERFLPAYITPYKGGYDLEVQIYRGLWMLRWYLDNFGANDRIEAEKLHRSVEDYIDRQVAKLPAGSDGLVLQPYWGPGLKRPNAKGSIVGFSAVHTRFHLVRAIYEGLAFALREGLDEIRKKTHRKPDYIVLSGGGSVNEIVPQIVADVFGIECHISATPESSSLGGARAGFVSAGVYSSPKEAVNNRVKEGKVILPNPQNHAVYERLYHDVYLNRYPSLKKVYNNCKKFYLDNNKD